jgi:hypothetical protein
VSDHAPFASVEGRLETAGCDRIPLPWVATSGPVPVDESLKSQARPHKKQHPMLDVSPGIVANGKPLRYFCGLASRTHC